ncbi:hypothetical protein IC575_022105 [Cucumis melo]
MYIKVNVLVADLPMFRMRKRKITTDVLDVCNTKGNFVYVLVGWEGSAVDSLILKMPLHDKTDSKCQRVFTIFHQTSPFCTYILKAHKALVFVIGYYYLCDASYPNAEGFLVLYKGQWYNLQEWRGAENATITVKEYFNMKHSSARNVIECAFDVLNGR